ncbi:hypothetical protein [Nonomuraea sp. NPDC049400]|uniref:hypothetical protein n=1 Tax=Nonomuraea sp. NPDC049400 TaxID=3364352 RepID=UPI00379B0958
MSETERSSEPVEPADFANEGGRRERALMAAGVLLGTVMLATAGILVSGEVGTRQLNAVDWPGTASGGPTGSIPVAVESRAGALRRSSSPPPAALSPSSSLPPSAHPASALPPSSRLGRPARRTTPPATTPPVRPGAATRPSFVSPEEPAVSRTPPPVRPSTPSVTDTLLSLLPPLTATTAPEHTPPVKTRKPRKPRKP